MFSFNVLTGAIQIYFAENSRKNRMFFLFQAAESRDNVQQLFNILEFWQLVKFNCSRNVHRVRMSFIVIVKVS